MPMEREAALSPGSLAPAIDLDFHRRQIEGRPALVLCSGLIVGLVTPAHLLNAAIVLILAILFRKSSARWMVLAAFAVGLVLAPSPAAAVRDSTWLQGAAEIVSAPRRYEHYDAFELELAGRRYLAEVPSAEGISWGDRFSIAGVATPFPDEIAPIYAAQGVSGKVRLDPSAMTRAGYGPAFFRLADSWRQSFFAFAAGSMNKAEAEWADAICFRSGALPMESRDALKRTGTVHVVAASGLHVFAIALAFQWLLGFLPIPRWAVVGLVSCLLALYAVAVGLHPPVLRAALMSVAFLAAYLIRREPDGLSALGVAAIACLLWNPAGVLDAGFQLSFVAVASLIVFHRRPTLRPRTAVGLVLQRSGQLAYASMVLALAMEPLVAYHMGMVSLVSIPANVVVVASASALLPVSIGAFGLSLLAPGPAAALMSLLASPLIDVVRWVADVLGGLPFAALDVPPFNAYWLVAYYGAGLLLWRAQPRRPSSD